LVFSFEPRCQTPANVIGTPVERTTRFTRLLHLPGMESHTAGARLKNVQHWPGMVLNLFATRSHARSSIYHSSFVVH
jgi:hypothetical protein